MLQPENIVFDNVSVQVEYDDEKNCIAAPDFDFQDVEFECGISHSDEKDHEDGITSRLVSVQIRLNNCSGKKTPYKIDIKVSGIFRWLLKSTSPVERKNLVVVNGATILYGAIREMVLSITSRSVAGALTLPSFNFADAAPSTKVENAVASGSHTVDPPSKSRARRVSTSKSS